MRKVLHSLVEGEDAPPKDGKYSASEWLLTEILILPFWPQIKPIELTCINECVRYFSTMASSLTRSEGTSLDIPRVLTGMFRDQGILVFFIFIGPPSLSPRATCFNTFNIPSFIL